MRSGSAESCERSIYAGEPGEKRSGPAARLGVRGEGGAGLWRSSVRCDFLREPGGDESLPTSGSKKEGRLWRAGGERTVEMKDATELAASKSRFATDMRPAARWRNPNPNPKGSAPHAKALFRAAPPTVRRFASVRVAGALIAAAGVMSNEVKDFVAGCAGGVLQVLSGHPLDTLKVRLQTQSAGGPQFTGMMDCFSKTVASEGVCIPSPLASMSHLYRSAAVCGPL